MLTRKSNRASGVQVLHTNWGIIVQATREMLVHHEFARDGLFPGDAGAQGRQRHTDTDPAGRVIRIYRKSKHQFAVWREWSPDEKAAHQQQLEREREIEDAKRRVGAWPVSADKYRSEVRIAFEYGSGMVENVFCSGRLGGYRYDDATMDRAKYLLDQLRVLHETGAIVMDRMLREENTPACLAGTVRAADAARRDKAFQQFIQGVTK